MVVGEIYDVRTRSADSKDIYKWKMGTPAELMHPKASSRVYLDTIANCMF